ncbi:MAG: exosome complex RNA-binding protein Csl4 [Desulfurococcales archaeon]|nr:exosome complex RNA-binding protein Csl4 [Desulfurococcales archaeon]
MKSIVTPGDELGVVEEYLEGEGIYENGNGYLRSMYTGKAFYDMVKRTANVIPARKAKFPRPGDTVIGVVTTIKPDMVILDVYGKVILSGRTIIVEEFSGTLTGLIPINLVAHEYVKDVHDYFYIGDIIIAQVTGSRNPFQLSTKKLMHGVVHSLCPECNTPLDIVNERTMKCPNCGRTVKKKVALIKNRDKIYHKMKRILSFYIY